MSLKKLSKTHIRLNSGGCYLLAAYKYTDVLLDSLQGFIVSVTFCYRNGEVGFCFELLNMSLLRILSQCHLSQLLIIQYFLSKLSTKN